MAVERIVEGTREFEWAAHMHMARYRAVAPHVSGRRVLDAACGSGYGSAFLAERAQFVLGLDISDEAVIDARKRYAKPNLQFGTANLESLPVADESFDVITSFETLEHVDDPPRAIAELTRVLRHGGLLVVSVPNGAVDATSGNPYHKHLFDLDTLKSQLSRGLSVRAVRGLSDDFTHQALADAEVPSWIKRLVPAPVKDRINAVRRARGRFSGEAELSAAPCWVLECQRP